MFLDVPSFDFTNSEPLGGGDALAFFGAVWQFGGMSNQPPTPELLAELEKQALAFIAGMQALGRFTHANSPEYREVLKKTQAAKEAYEAAAAQIPDAPNP